MSADAESLLQGLPWGVVVLDAHGSVLRLNEQAARWWGVRPQEVQCKPWGPATAGTLPADLLQALQAVTSSPARPDAAYFLPHHQEWITMTSAHQGDGWVVYWQDVTEREQAAQELLHVKDELARRATDNYATLYNSMDEGFCILEVLFDAAQHPVDYRFLDVNPAFEKHTGLRGAQGKTICELVPDIEPHWAAIYGRVALTGESTRLEEHSESMGRWFNLYAFSVGPRQNRHVGVLFADVTERKRTEEARRESDAHLRQAVGLAHLGICQWDYQTDLMRGNDERFLMLGLDPARAEITVAEAIALTHPDDRPAWAGIREQLEARGEFRADYRIVRPGDGAVRWLSEVGRVVEWQHDKPARIHSVLLDVTDSHEAAEALRQSEARYRSLFDNMEQGFCLLEQVATAPGAPTDYRYRAVNPAFERHSGLADATGRTIRELVPGVEPYIMAIFDEVATSGESRRFGGYVADLDRWVEVEAVAEAQPGHLAVLFSDVSARHRAEQTLRESEARAQAARAEAVQAQAAAEAQRQRLHRLVAEAPALIATLRAPTTSSSWPMRASAACSGAASWWAGPTARPRPI
ncbi:hypothetical protein BEN47_05755 [Hymenobacter lapidarius]|uniref:histidine kinase n=2 Tax=Hymenobacter lapidarius TaxID=1908237 RepID=A0A1G1SS50_9BACT|nr:hypothetical protein BEN47_05755 [Hymenobacter lapidarius]